MKGDDDSKGDDGDGDGEDKDEYDEVVQGKKVPSTGSLWKSFDILESRQRQVLYNHQLSGSTIPSILILQLLLSILVRIQTVHWLKGRLASRIAVCR